MIIFPDRFMYLNTPRCASRSVKTALKQVGGCIVDKVHHTRPDLVAEAKAQYKVPAITMFRHPAHILLSYWWKHRSYLGTTFSEYIERGKTIVLWHRVFPYSELTDEYFPYEKGIPALFEHLGLPAPAVVPSIGMRLHDRPDHSYITGEHLKTVWEHFPDDMELYEKLINGNDRIS